MLKSKAATGRAATKTPGKSAAVIAIASMLVSGVAIINEVDADNEAPRRLNARAVGNTPHEQSGNGIPIIAPRIAPPMPDFPKAQTIQDGGTIICNIPASISPNIK